MIRADMLKTCQFGKYIFFGKIAYYYLNQIIIHLPKLMSLSYLIVKSLTLIWGYFRIVSGVENEPIGFSMTSSLR
jgi:hypothetical protein